MSESISEELKPALSPLLLTLAGLSETIKAYDKRIAKLSCESYPETELL